MEKHSVSRLIGPPPGYIGYEDGGQLSEAIRTKPYSLVLFDEIEKAHKDIYNILLQIMDEGALTDSQGRKIDFKNTIVIMTSNIGARSIIEPKRLGFGDTNENNNDRMKSQINDALRMEFNPEFLNRLDEIVIFNNLSKDDIIEICKIMLDEVKSLALDIGITIEFDGSVYEHIANVGYDKQYGARPIRRIITNEIENALSDKIIDKEIARGDFIEILYDDGIKIVKK
jgi:ATP-dependent Clp protease ATP-binding subunit ClpC